MMFQKFCFYILKKKGWKFISNIPKDLNSFVFIGAPHTSNIDFFLAMGICHYMKKNARFVIKKEWVKFPFSLIMKPLGAYGLDRELINEKQNLNSTDLMASFFSKEELVLMIAPEGTRKPTPTWKTGFYYIAQKGNVPIVLGFADYSKKVAGLGMVIYPSDFETDMRVIMEFYREVKGKVNSNFLPDSRFI